MEIPACWLKRSSNKGRGSYLPLFLIFVDLLKIWAQREIPPFTPSWPPGQSSKPTSFASVPTVVRC
jgi:hypothetical protein